jgi:hypothetical protein
LIFVRSILPPPNLRLQLFIERVMFSKKEVLSQRGSLIEISKSKVKRSIHELKREQETLDKKEKQLLEKARCYMKNGDKAKARILAKQIGILRQVSAKFLEHCVALDTDFQIKSSKNKLSKVHLDYAKQNSYINREISMASIRSIGNDYVLSSVENEAIESLRKWF